MLNETQRLPVGTRVTTPDGDAVVFSTSDSEFVTFEGATYHIVLVAFRPTHTMAGIKRAYRSDNVAEMKG